MEDGTRSRPCCWRTTLGPTAAQACPGRVTVPRRPDVAPRWKPNASRRALYEHTSSLFARAGIALSISEANTPEWEGTYVSLTGTIDEFYSAGGGTNVNISDGSVLKGVKEAEVVSDLVSGGGPLVVVGGAAHRRHARRVAPCGVGDHDAVISAGRVPG